MDIEYKPRWKTPQMIVLVRNNPEEMVLSGCKYGTEGSEAGGKDNMHTSCDIEGPCASCTILSDT